MSNAQIEKDRVEWAYAQTKKKKRTRLTIDDFEELGVNIPQELWNALKKIEDPEKYLDYFFRMLSFVTPRLNAIDIVSTEDSDGGGKANLANFTPKDLTNVLRSERE